MLHFLLPSVVCNYIFWIKLLLKHFQLWSFNSAAQLSVRRTLMFELVKSLFFLLNAIFVNEQAWEVVALCRIIRGALGRFAILFRDTLTYTQVDYIRFARILSLKRQLNLKS